LENVGTDNIIVGSYITKSNNYKEKIKNIKERKMLQGILEAAEEEKSPVILQTSSSAIKYMGLRIYCKND